MAYERVTVDNVVEKIGQVSVKQTIASESEELFTLDFIDTVLQGIDTRITELTGERGVMEVKRAAVLIEAKKVKLKKEVMYEPPKTEGN